ncbi:MAG: hypothetical protein JSR77_17920 [Planctomycetes bacterium]|nr:hypothetical protein [Planctomycetota bacterium]
MDVSIVRLRALNGTPLEDEGTRSVVIAAAQGLAEREGVVLARIDVAPDSITMELGLDKLAAVGFLAELRRQTNAWYEGKYRDGPLWGTPKPGTFDDDGYGGKSDDEGWRG